jgi:Glycosyl transferase family 2
VAAVASLAAAVAVAVAAVGNLSWITPPMNCGKSSVGIVYTMREKFGWVLPSLTRLYAFTEMPFTLYIVDGCYPAEVRAGMEAFLSEHADEGKVVWIQSKDFLYPNESLNAAVDQVREECLCLIQNDVLVDPGYMSAMLRTFEATDCEIVAPLTWEYEGGTRDLHRGRDGTGEEIVRVDDGLLVDQACPVEEVAGYKRCGYFEMHALMMTTKAARALTPLPRLSSREQYDFGIRAFKAGMRAFLAHDAFVGYVTPPLQAMDRAFFAFRWDEHQALQSHRYLASECKVRNLPDVLPWVHTMNGFLADEKLVRPEFGFSERDIYLERYVDPEFAALLQKTVPPGVG